MVARQSVPFSAFTFGFLRLIRVQNLLIVVLTQFMARVFLVGPGEGDGRAQLITDPTIWLLSISTACIAAAGYIINDYFDVKIDLVNKPKRVVIGRYLKRRVAMGVHQILNVVGCLIGLYLSKWIFLIDVISVSLLWFYSAQFKRQPLIGNLIVSLLTAFALVTLAIYYRHNVGMLLIYALFSFGIALHNFRLNFIFLLLLLPLAWLTYQLVLADTRRDFGYLSSLCKLIMLLGVVSMIWA